MDNSFFHFKDDFTIYRNEMGFPFNEKSECDENSYTFSSFNKPPLLDEIYFSYEEAPCQLNEIKDPSKTQAIKVNGDDENINKSNKIDEGRSPLLGKSKENENNKNISTKENSNLNEEVKIVKVANNLNREEVVKIKKKPKFQIDITTPSYFKFESAKKHWKTEISQRFTSCLNNKIESSDLLEELKNKIHKPNSLLFTANVKESDNCAFLEKNLRTILTIGKEINNNQKNNDDNISKIYEYFEKIGYNNLSDKMIAIKNLLEMSYEDFIKKFYESDEFNNFKKKEKTIFFDEETRKQEGFSISENLGLIRLFRRKRERDEKKS